MIRTFAAALATTTCIVALATPAAAQTREFNVPAGSLRTALDSYARQSGRQVIYGGDVQSARSPGVRGARSADDALDAILAGTGFVARKDRSGAVAIVKAGNAPGAPGNVVSSGEGSGGTGSAEIVVTGSHLRGISETASPLVAISQEEIRRSGASTTQQLLRTVTQNFSGGANEYTAGISVRGGASQNIGYGAGVNLRGLGNSSTLILIDGQRVAPGGGDGGFVDVSTIPLSVLQSVEVLTDGASAIYGSDAVGGVVNFKLRRDFDGPETSVRYGTVTDGNYDEFQVSQLLGTRWSGGSAWVNVDYLRKSDLDASDRGYASPLASGPTDLFPAERRLSIFGSASQQLAPSTSVSARGYYNERRVRANVFNPFLLQQSESKIKSRQYGGFVTLDSDLSSTWALRTTLNASVNETRPITEILDEQSAVTDTFGASTKLQTYSAEAVIDGTVLTVPGGDVKLAVGSGYRRESLLTRPLEGIPSLASPFSIKRHVFSAYGEIAIPIVGAANELDLIHRLSLSGALRYERYSDFGSSWNPKLGIVFAPAEAIGFRATYGKSFRAPYLGQLDNTFLVGILYEAPNPDAGRDSLIAQIVGGAKPGLGPERANTWTAGFDLAPSRNIKFSGTYFDIRYRGRIGTANGFFDAFTNPLLASFLSVPADQNVLSAIAALEPSRFINITSSPLGAAEATLDLRLQNAAETYENGVDLQVNAWSDTSLGKLSGGVSATWLFNYENRASATDPKVSALNTLFNPLDLRLRSYVSLDTGGVNFSLFGNYQTSYKDTQSTPFRRVDSWTTIDASLTYSVPQESDNLLRGLEISLSAINLFDTAPPFITDQNPAYANPGFDTENGNPLGRFVALTVRKKW